MLTQQLPRVWGRVDRHAFETSAQQILVERAQLSRLVLLLAHDAANAPFPALVRAAIWLSAVAAADWFAHCAISNAFRVLLRHPVVTAAIEHAEMYVEIFAQAQRGRSRAC